MTGEYLRVAGRVAFISCMMYNDGEESKAGAA
jgi:hypothetical protein